MATIATAEDSVSAAILRVILCMAVQIDVFASFFLRTGRPAGITADVAIGLQPVLAASLRTVARRIGTWVPGVCYSHNHWIHRAHDFFCDESHSPVTILHHCRAVLESRNHFLRNVLHAILHSSRET